MLAVDNRYVLGEEETRIAWRRKKGSNITGLWC